MNALKPSRSAELLDLRRSSAGPSGSWDPAARIQNAVRSFMAHDLRPKGNWVPEELRSDPFTVGDVGEFAAEAVTLTATTCRQAMRSRTSRAATRALGP